MITNIIFIIAAFSSAVITVLGLFSIFPLPSLIYDYKKRKNKEMRFAISWVILAMVYATLYLSFNIYVGSLREIEYEIIEPVKYAGIQNKNHGKFTSTNVSFILKDGSIFSIPDHDTKIHYVDNDNRDSDGNDVGHIGDSGVKIIKSYYVWNTKLYYLAVFCWGISDNYVSYKVYLKE